MSAAPEKSPEESPSPVESPVDYVKLINDRFTELKNTFIVSARELGTDVSDRLDAINATLSSECDLDMTDDVSGVSGPKHEIDMLDAMRSSRPDDFKRLLQVAQSAWDAPHVGRQRVAHQLASVFVTSLGPP